MSSIVATGSRLTPAPIVGAGVLLVITLVVVAAWRLAGQPAHFDAPARVVSERELRFQDRADGGVNVIDVRHAERSQVLPAGSGTDGFLRATLRTLARERLRRGIGSEPPFRLSWLADGRLMLEDPSTGRQVDLEAFGPTNAQRFARLLDKAPR
jgi:putative photosynthetic complex assembly protein